MARSSAAVRAAVLSVAVLGAGCAGGSHAPPPQPVASPALHTDAPGAVTASFAASDADFPNPERGWTYPLYLHRDTVDLAALRSGATGTAYSLVHVDVPLNDYLGDDLTQPLPPSVGADLDALFASARANGIKIVLRFEYNQGASYDASGGTSLDGDATSAAMIQHVQQLAPTLQRNDDVLATLEAGFIGEWGEWHDSSTSGIVPHADAWLSNPADVAAARSVLDAILAAVPPDRSVLLRYPEHKDALFATGGVPLTAAEAYGATPKARVGHHNDCYLSSSNDTWTYPADAASIEQWKSYIAADTQFDVPMGGETCGQDARNACSIALPETARLHFSYLNHEYNPVVYATWKSQGCYDTISKGFGYRLVLTTATYTPRAAAGASLDASVTLRNDGFASMYNARPVFLVLDDGTHRYPFPVDADPRRWQSGQTNTVTASVPLQGVAPGTYALAVWLPDASPGLQARPEFSVRFANDGVWDATQGYNVVGSVTVTP